MDEAIEVSVHRIKEIIDNFCDETFTTVDVLRAYSGAF